MALRAISSGVRAGVALMWRLAPLIAPINCALRLLLEAYSTRRRSLAGGDTTLKLLSKSGLSLITLRTVVTQFALSPFQIGLRPGASL